ncbi:bromodomain containing protein [Babesia ovis]|uniref:Bromodomain containing protein n=1 Tax=Babesia ovis TaxID=5869 RepID=A0A9W5T9V1_BABOV|nr:bromodomain containing protein [Babesia ovis]
MTTIYAESYINSPIVQAIGAEGTSAVREVLERDFAAYTAANLEANPDLLQSEDYAAKKQSLIDPNTHITPLCQLSRKTQDEAYDIAKMLIVEYKLIDANHVDMMGQTALFYGARDGWSRFCELLAQNGCDPNHQDKLGQTCLFYASREGHHETLETLIAYKADVNLLDTNKQNCLFYAARDGRIEAVQVLIKHGINHSLKDAQRRQAITFAKLKNQTEIVNLLKSLMKPSAPAPKRSLSDRLDMKGLLNNKSSSLEEAKTGVPIIPKSAGRPRKYRLQFRPFEDDANLWIDAPLIKIREFEMRFPELATWDKDAPFAPAATLRNPLIKQWHQVGLTLLSMLAKQEGGYVFERPVDPKKQNCPDYFDIVKNPMSFSCIKAKIRRNAYTNPQEFIDDCQLVFDNCFKYNKPETWIAQIGRNIETFFKAQLNELGFDSFIKKHQLIDMLMDKAKIYVESNDSRGEDVSLADIADTDIPMLDVPPDAPPMFDLTIGADNGGLTNATENTYTQPTSNGSQQNTTDDMTKQDSSNLCGIQVHDNTEAMSKNELDSSDDEDHSEPKHDS